MRRKRVFCSFLFNLSFNSKGFKPTRNAYRYFVVKRVHSSNVGFRQSFRMQRNGLVETWNTTGLQFAKPRSAVGWYEKRRFKLSMKMKFKQQVVSLCIYQSCIMLYVAFSWLNIIVHSSESSELFISFFNDILGHKFVSVFHYLALPFTKISGIFE